MLRRILLARHGQTAWNAVGKLQGGTDIPLNELGRDQARVVGRQLAGSRIDHVWASDLARARETAALIAAELELPEPRAPRIEPLLRERAFGVFEGLTRDEIAVQLPEAWQAWQARSAAPPGGEPRESATARMTTALLRIAGELADGQVALAVAHGGIMRLWLIERLGQEVPLIPNGAVWAIEVEVATRTFGAIRAADLGP